MRIPLWKDLRLSVWEPQNPDAVKVTLARSKPYEPVRRVLSMRGWMLLFVRYDWKDAKPAADASSPSVPDLVEQLTRELHRRSLRLEELGEDPDVLETVLMNVRGEVLGLQAALGMALGGVVAGGDADQRAYEHYWEWCARQEVGQ
jgi:hypothetical protein